MYYDTSTSECFGCYMFKTRTTESQEDKQFYGLIEATDTVNVARGKHSEQSSIYGGHYAAKGTDGNANQYTFSTCFSTISAPGETNWWYVDLQNIYILTEVKMFNRLDDSSMRSNAIYVHLGISLDNLTEVAYTPGQMDDIWSVPLPPSTTAQYVKLYHNGDAYFHLCEVQVFARAGKVTTE